MMRLVLVLAGLAAATALCPNACSGHGQCGEYDMCTCYQNWQSNDCSEQTCPFDIAFATTPNGDLNMDGDRYDNTQKLLVKSTGGAANQGTILENDDVLTLNKAVTVEADGTTTSEIVVGDAIRVADETFIVDSVITTSTFSLDHDRFTGVTTEVNVYKFLENVQSPKGTWESWVGDHPKDDEGHYYMECSNRGQCDRKTGTCECFDGYSGAACQRERCPNDCSGHGTCETIAELTHHNSTKLTVDQQGFYVHTAAADSATITVSKNPTTISVGDTIRLTSKDGQDLTVTAKDTTNPYTLTVSPALDIDAEFGSRIYLVPQYDMWDANKDRACICDSPYTGGDCSLRACPTGDDPLTVFSNIGATLNTELGTTSVRQRNEKQNIYLNTARGSLSGTFTLTFTDTFGQKWTTEKIYVNERLSSKAYVSATNLAVVTFSPSLPYGELEVGDFLMVGDERQEVLTTYPIVSTTEHRPIKLGGVVDSVAVRNVFAVSSTNVNCFRAGPAKGIKAALQGLPNGIVPAVTTENFNTGTLIGHHMGGISTASGLTSIKGVLGSYDKQESGEAAALGRNLMYFGNNGGIAPYDMVRVTSTGGKSEFMQLRNVDVFPSTGSVEVLLGKGKLTAQTAAETAALQDASSLGIGANTYGAIYRNGGYHVRVTFTENSGDLPEMDVDESGLYSVFFREFTATVTAAEPRKVVARLHGDLQFNSDTTYPIPQRGLTTGKAAERGGGHNTMFAGDRYDLRVMAGMKVKVADQVRTVVTDINSASTTGDANFYVDEDFKACEVSETVDGVEYIFHLYPVEQLYDDSTYAALTLSKALYGGSSTTLTLAGTMADYGNGRSLTLSAAAAATAAAGWRYSGISAEDISIDAAHLGTSVADLLPNGAAMFISGGNGGGDFVVGASTTTKINAMAAGATPTAATLAAQAWVIRVYLSLAAGQASSGATATPPLYIAGRTNWVTVTDQRPLVWSNADLELVGKTRVLDSPSRVALRGVMAGGAGSLTMTLDGTVLKLVVTGLNTWTVSGTDVANANFLNHFGYDNAGTETTQDLFITLSGCSANTQYNIEYPVTGITSTTLTFSTPYSGAISNTDPSCAGNTVTFVARSGGLIDSKAIAIDDRVKVQQANSVYETRTVDKIWGTALDVTMFSVVDAYSNVNNLQDLDAWVDESGSTEEIECSRRGLCDQETGQCQCFAGYTSNNCGTQNALAS